MLKEIPLDAVKLEDTFWRFYQDLVTNTVIPYQYKVLNDSIKVDVQAERQDSSLPNGKSHALENFRIVSGEKVGEHFGWIFQDSDVYKWLESVGYSLINQPDFELESLADEVIDLIGKAQAKNGYINTYFQIKNLELKYRMLHFSHELYCIGHLIEAGISYDKGTGKRKLLQIAEKAIEDIEANFGYDDGKIRGADGHQEIELALTRLYEYTRKKKYLNLAEFFIEVRGVDANFYQKQVEKNIRESLDMNQYHIDTSYLQAEVCPKNQRIAQGHAVRMLYMAAGMAKIANYTHDNELIEACEAIWEDIIKYKIYITGGVGSTVHGEAFVGKYDLPNDTMYCETCASIALVYFAYEMFKISPRKEYIDILEKTLYNGVLSSISLDGQHFLYVNPLEVHPDSCKHNPDKGHVKTTRPEWLGCACCPPNFARLISSLQKYVYIKNNDETYINLFVCSKLKLNDIEIMQKTNFPCENTIKIYVKSNKQNVYIRKPEWMENIQIKTKSPLTETKEYFIVRVKGSSRIDISFEQPLLAIRSNPKLWANTNLIAFQRGPFIYCGEGVDNIEDLFCYRICMDNINKYKCSLNNETLTKLPILKIPARKIIEWEEKALYQFVDSKEDSKGAALTLIPYHLWGNRGVTAMRIWFPINFC